MSDIAIVVVGYNREMSLSRLLNSLLNAYYDHDNVPLVISIDKSNNPKVADIANAYNWPFGKKIVSFQLKNLGLRDHIIKCGNLSMEYGSVIVLEDDLLVSPSFYIYSKEAIHKYESNDKIAGISLYSHLWNTNCSRPFTPADDGTDAYFLQFAQSWGQVWTAKMWKSFIDWYKKNSGPMVQEQDMPERVTSWPDTSWLKYYIRYIVKTNRFFLYPKISFSTNFGDTGQHVTESSSSYQVPLLLSIKREYNFPEFNDNSICYDVFYERMGLWKSLGLPANEVCLDLYSTKGNRQKARYWITTEHLNYAIFDSFSLTMRPHEENISSAIQGNDIFCYDTNVSHINNFSNSRRSSMLKKIKYDIRDIKKESIWFYSFFLFKNAICHRSRRLIRK